MFRKHLGQITLVLLVLLFVLKFFLGGCRLWLCALFVGLVVSYMILSDIYSAGEDENSGSSRKQEK